VAGDGAIRCAIAPYVGYNPVKHGYVTRVANWPYSTFHRFFARGIYPADWGGMNVVDIVAGE